MPIYEKPVRMMMPDLATKLADPPGTAFTREAALGWFADNYPKIKAGTVVAHLERFSTNSPSRLSHSVRPEEDLFFKIDSTRFRRFDSRSDPVPLRRGATDAPISSRDVAVVCHSSSSELNGDDSSVGPNEFAYESDLRDFLARHLTLIEPGLRLYTDEDIDGIEFPVGGRYIDILAVDSSQQLVVIELKVSRGHERTIGQLLRYMAWIEKNQAETGQRVRGVIAARQISEDLKLACAYLPDVSLFEYQLSVTLRAVLIERLR